MATATMDKPRTRRSRGVVAVTIAAAAIPTVLSAQGMVLVAYHALSLPMMTSIGLAGFLELALVASALSARDATLRGQSPRVDLMATWILSLVSGVLSACHEFIGVSDRAVAMTLLAATVRIVAPLVACWLWHRVVAGDAAEQTDRSWRERSADNSALNVAVSARRCAQEPSPSSQRRLEADYVKLLRRHPEVPMNQIHDVVSAVAAVDSLPPLASTPTDIRTLSRPLPELVRIPNPVDMRELAPAPELVEASTSQPVQEDSTQVREDTPETQDVSTDAESLSLSKDPTIESTESSYSALVELGLASPEQLGLAPQKASENEDTGEVATLAVPKLPAKPKTTRTRTSTKTTKTAAAAKPRTRTSKARVPELDLSKPSTAQTRKAAPVEPKNSKTQAEQPVEA